MDYDDTEDQIIVLFDDTAGIEPELSIEQDAHNPAITNILLNGDIACTVPTDQAPLVSDIVLAPETLASDFGV
jgi:hypothetical protein